MIARLNVGGPAQHVLHLSRELETRLPETTLVAGRVGEDEGSMEYFADKLGVKPLFIGQLQREIAPLQDASAVGGSSADPRAAPQILHTHTAKAGTIGRSQPCSPARPGPRWSCTPSTATCSAATSARAYGVLPHGRALARAGERRPDRRLTGSTGRPGGDEDRAALERSPCRQARARPRRPDRPRTPGCARPPSRRARPRRIDGSSSDGSAG